MDFHKLLLSKGFQLLITVNPFEKIYGNGVFTGTVVIDKDEQIFYPYLTTDDETKPNPNYRTVKIFTELELDEYCKQKI